MAIWFSMALVEILVIQTKILEKSAKSQLT